MWDEVFSSYQSHCSLWSSVTKKILFWWILWQFCGKSSSGRRRGLWFEECGRMHKILAVCHWRSVQFWLFLLTWFYSSFNYRKKACRFENILNMKVFCHCFVIKYLYVYIFLLRFPETVCQRTVNMFLFRCCGITWNCIKIQDSLCIFCGMLRVSFVSYGGLSCLLFFSVYFCCL